MTRVHAAGLWPRKVHHSGFTQERETFLRENIEVDPAMLADSMGVTERFVRMYQRKLGVRGLSGNHRKAQI